VKGAATPLNRTARRRRARVKSVAELPLDDGPRVGPELWREIDGVRFCHWDRWLLRLAITEPGGLRSIAQEFHRRAQNDRRPDRTAEALGAQVADLQTRLDGLGRTPESILDEQERASEWLRAKAFHRVWHASGPRKTEAMRRTPRAVLEERVMRGNRRFFAASPGPYAEKLQATVGQDWQDWRGTGRGSLCRTSEAAFSVQRKTIDRRRDCALGARAPGAGTIVTLARVTIAPHRGATPPTKGPRP
jgi:hypothetical protein